MLVDKQGRLSYIAAGVAAMNGGCLHFALKGD